MKCSDSRARVGRSYLGAGCVQRSGAASSDTHIRTAHCADVFQQTLKTPLNHMNKIHSLHVYENKPKIVVDTHYSKAYNYECKTEQDSRETRFFDNKD